MSADTRRYTRRTRARLATWQASQAAIAADLKADPGGYLRRARVRAMVQQKADEARAAGRDVAADTYLGYIAGIDRMDNLMREIQEGGPHDV